MLCVSPLSPPPRKGNSGIRSKLRIRIEGNIENRNCHCIRVDYDDDKEEEKENGEEKGRMKMRQMMWRKKRRRRKREYKVLTKMVRFFSLAPKYSYFYYKEKIIEIFTVTETY